MGKIMKNGISYSGGTVENIESKVTEAVKNALKNSIKIVELDPVDYTLDPYEVADVFVLYNDKIPDGYIPIGFRDIDFDYGSNKPVLLKRLHPYFDNTRACVGMKNPDRNTVTGKLWIRLICVKNTNVSFIN